MNPTKQFWTLLKFYATSSPVAWLLPIAFCSPLLFMTRGEPSFTMLLMTQNQFLVLLLGVLVLAPEILSSPKSPLANGLGSEFIRTRAVDKPILARSKAAFFYSAVLLVPLAIAVYSARLPDLQVTLYPKQAQADCLSHIAGSTLVSVAKGYPDRVSIPSGHLLIALWRVWVFLIISVVTQVLIYALYPLRYRRYYFWAALLLVSFTPLFTMMARPGATALDQHCFFLYAAHPAAFWGAGAAALLLGQVWCERRFCRLEQ